MQFIIGAYTQIPYGSSNEEYSEVLEEQIKPILSYLYYNPTLKLVLKLGIDFYEWIDTNNSEISMLIFELCKKGQLELLSSSAYDCILPLIPSHERSKFIEITTSYIRKKFKIKPYGFHISYNIFTPSLISSINQSSLTYIINSPYSQQIGKVVTNKPFYMSNQGKYCCIFPTEDKLSKFISDLDIEKHDLNVIKSELKKIIKNSTGSLSTYYINLDQLRSSKFTLSIFSFLFNELSEKITLPSLYLKEKAINNTFYLPEGIYGRDFILGKSFSLHQYIYENNFLNKFYFCSSYLKDAVRFVKKNTDERKLYDSESLKASTGAVYIPCNYHLYNILKSSDVHLCNMEKILSNTKSNLIPVSTYINNKIHSHEIIFNRYFAVYLNSKGACIDRLSYFPLLHDFVCIQNNGLFTDVFHFEKNNKELNLISKNYDLSSFDKKRQDFIASTSFDFDQNQINLTKIFKFRLNQITVDIDIENVGNTVISNIIYENLSDISFTKELDIFDIDSNLITNEKDINGFFIKNNSYYVAITFNSLMNVKNELIYEKNNISSGLTSNYLCNRVKVLKNLNISPNDNIHLSMTIKIEKSKEIRNDT